MFQRATDVVDKILRGTKPADISVEQPTKFDLIFNLITAKAVGASQLRDTRLRTAAARRYNPTESAMMRRPRNPGDMRRSRAQALLAGSVRHETIIRPYPRQQPFRARRAERAPRLHHQA